MLWPLFQGYSMLYDATRSKCDTEYNAVRKRCGIQSEAIRDARQYENYVEWNKRQSEAIYLPVGGNTERRAAEHAAVERRVNLVACVVKCETV
jgi:hypothetical protein